MRSTARALLIWIVKSKSSIASKTLCEVSCFVNQAVNCSENTSLPIKVGNYSTSRTSSAWNWGTRRSVVITCCTRSNSWTGYALLSCSIESKSSIACLTFCFISSVKSSTICWRGHTWKTSNLWNFSSWTSSTLSIMLTSSTWSIDCRASLTSRNWRFPPVVSIASITSHTVNIDSCTEGKTSTSSPHTGPLVSRRTAWRTS